jgi:hypothetical protein
MNIEDDIILLEVQIQNITPHPMYLEVISFDPAPGFKTTNYNIVQQQQQSERSQEDDQEEKYDSGSSLMAHDISLRHRPFSIAAPHAFNTNACFLLCEND